MIKPSGFYNQKAKRLLEFCRFIIECYGSLDSLFKLTVNKARKKLIAIKGIGKETADTILLYAGNKPVFVVDTYTKKFVKVHDLTVETDYGFLQSFFSRNLPVDTRLYQNYHALIVRWGKEN